MEALPGDILLAYGLDPVVYKIDKLDSGLINHTWKVTGPVNGYILQKVNHHIFKAPEDIAHNLDALNQYIKKTDPYYLFVAPLLSFAGNPFVKTREGDYFRLFPYIQNSHTINTVSTATEAYEAARQFGRFTSVFKGFDLSKLKYTLADFHNLSLRIDQFNRACENAYPEVLKAAINEVNDVKQLVSIAIEYKNLINNPEVPLRLIHHDTKISNILFDDNNKGLCVIDLDTVMPGYFFSDAGDMLRTYLSPANEEEPDFSKITIRHDFFKAIYDGYSEQMGDSLSPTEKKHFIFAGKFMIYMQAVRFLTDHLNNDVYYQVKYPGHNLTRAKNQLYFLHRYLDAEPHLAQLIQF